MTNGLKSLPLPGLDAQNPLGFLASLGLLRVLDDHARRSGSHRPKLCFLEDGQHVAQIWSSLGLDGIKAIVLEDAGLQGRSQALRLAYDDEGNLVDFDAPNATRDLKPSPTGARDYLLRAANGPRRDADLAAGFFSELVQALKGDTKPTALHFTAGQQAFLSMVERLRCGISMGDIEEALSGPWMYASTLPSLSWDSSTARSYALRASDPSKEKRSSIAAANWLAVQGLAFFPVHVRAGRLKTTGIHGVWNDMVFTWPLWAVPVDMRTAMALLRSDPRRYTARQRAAAGISVVLQCGILRSDYGSFTPSSVVVPRSD